MSDDYEDSVDLQFRPTFSNLSTNIGGRRLIGNHYKVPCVELAQFLLGKILVRKFEGLTLKGRIVETESYPGYDDRASHSYCGKRTPRNKPMFMEPGTTYVYFTYGMYHCFNISSEGEGAAVLLRALEPLEGIETMKYLRNNFSVKKNIVSSKDRRSIKKMKLHELCNGPSKLCISMAIDKTCNEQNLGVWDEMWIESDDYVLDKSKIVLCPRIGIDSAGEEAASKDLRFYILGNIAVSKRNKEKEHNLINQSNGLVL